LGYATDSYGRCHPAPIPGCGKVKRTGFVYECTECKFYAADITQEGKSITYVAIPSKDQPGFSCAPSTTYDSAEDHKYACNNNGGGGDFGEIVREKSLTVFISKRVDSNTDSD